MFNKLFGGGKKEKPKESNNKITETLQMLDKKISDCELLIQNLDVRQKNLQEEAKKKLKAGDKEGAKRLLNKKKKLLEQLKQTEGAMAMMEEQRMTLETTGQTIEIINTLKETSNVVKEAMKELNVESLDELREQMEEAKAQMEEVNDFFTNYANEGMEEVEDELRMLEEEEAAKNKNIMPEANKEKIEDNNKNKVKNEEFDLENFMNA